MFCCLEPAVSQASLPLQSFILKEANHSWSQGHKGEEVQAARPLEAEACRSNDFTSATFYWSTQVTVSAKSQGVGNLTLALDGRNGKVTMQKMVASILQAVSHKELEAEYL